MRRTIISYKLTLTTLAEKNNADKARVQLHVVGLLRANDRAESGE